MDAARRRREDQRWRIFGERVIYDNPWVRLVLVDVEPPDGRRFEHHVVRLQRVVITAVLDGGRVLMVWRHRFVTDAWAWELPGGIADQDEEPAQTAVREVEEETGWRPRSVRHLLTFQPMVGMVDTPHELYVTDEADHIGEPTDLEEGIAQVEWVPLSDVRELIRKDEIAGSGSLVALLYLLAFGSDSSVTR